MQLGYACNQNSAGSGCIKIPLSRSGQCCHIHHCQMTWRQKYQNFSKYLIALPLVLVSANDVVPAAGLWAFPLPNVGHRHYEP